MGIRCYWAKDQGSEVMVQVLWVRDFQHAGYAVRALSCVQGTKIQR